MELNVSTTFGLIVFLVSTLSESDNVICTLRALEGLIERGIERGENENIISQLNQSIKTQLFQEHFIQRSRVPAACLIKSLCLPVIWHFHFKFRAICPVNSQ